LSGKYRRNQPEPEGTRRLAGWAEPPIRDEERLWRIVDTLVEIAQSRDVSVAQVGLTWTMGRSSVTSIVIGGRTSEQLKDNLGAADLVLTAEERSRLDAVSAPPILYPYWHQLQSAKDRLGKADLSLLGAYL
jgi:aryl-alcohol dehydrogenase-like predicted oxidoreductase